VVGGGITVDLHTLDIYGQWSLGRVYPYSTTPGVSFLAGYITSSGNTSFLTSSLLQGGGINTNVTVPTGYIPFVGVTTGINHAYGGVTSSEFGLSFPISAPTVTVNPTSYGFSIDRNKEQ
jgi:filamentous hemagglutinin